MRIAHVTYTSSDMVLGIEAYVLRLAAEQRARGHSVLVITNCEGLLSDFCRRNSVPVAVIAVNWKPDERQGGRPAAATIQSLTAQFKNINADIVNCHVAPAAVATITAANQVRIPCIFTLHINPKDPSGFKAMKNAGLKFATVTVSRRNFQALKKIGIPGADLYYVPCGTGEAVSIPLADRERSHRPNLICVGSLDRNKGQDLAILAMNRLRRMRGGDCPLLNIYGADLGEEAYLKEMVSALDLEDIVQFHGFQANILERCPSSDMLVMSSRSETGPLVVLEAMSRGMPIVASDVGEVAEMLPDQRYGRIVPVNSIVALADAIDALLSDIADGRFDPALPIERHRSSYTVAKMAERLEVVYEKVLAGNSSFAQRF